MLPPVAPASPLMQGWGAPVQPHTATYAQPPPDSAVDMNGYYDERGEPRF
jgi:hypothetical protein